MTAELLLIIFVGVAALSIVVQGYFAVKTMRSAQGLTERVRSLSTDLETEGRQVISQLQEVTAGLDYLRNVFEDMGDRFDEVGQMFEARTQDVDQLVGRLVEVGNRQATKVNEVVTDTVHKFEETTGVLQEDVLKPIVEISSLVKGLKTGVDYLFSARAARKKEADYPEEDHFI